MIAPERLDVCVLFAEMPAEIRERLAEKFTETSAPAQHVIFSEGDPGDALYLVAEGRVAIQKTVDRKRGTSKTLSLLGPGDFFGEMALLEKAPRWASAIAQTPAVLLRLPGEDFRAWMSADTRVPLKFLLPFVQSLNNRLRQTTREMLLLFDVGGLLAKDTESDPLAAHLTEVLGRGFDESVVAGCYLWNDFSGEYDLKATTGPWPPGARAGKPRANALFRWMAEKNECVLSGGWSSDERFDDAGRREWPPFQSLLAAPIAGESFPRGFVVFGTEAEPDYFTTTHRRVIAGVVNMAAPAFENAALRAERSSRERLVRARQGALGL